MPTYDFNQVTLRHSDTPTPWHFLLWYFDTVTIYYWLRHSDLNHTNYCPPEKKLFSLKKWTVHSKTGPFDKQFCMANTAFFTSYTTFLSFNKEIFYSRQMWLYEILISTFRQDKNSNFVSYLFSSPTSEYAFPNSV
jgi:hypothetical protein